MSAVFFEQRLPEAAPFVIAHPATDTLGKAGHYHPEGQLAVVADGVVVIEIEGQSWFMPPGRISWIPPGVVHAATPVGPTAGWTAYLPAAHCARLPAAPAILKLDDLTSTLIKRMSGWRPDVEAFSKAQLRIVEVLLDELRDAEHDCMRLPAPRNRQLIAMTAAIMRDPASKNQIADWALTFGLSERSLTRRFRDETGLTFVQWRSLARMARGLDMLSRDTTVTEIALTLGYDSISSFSAMFQRTFHVSPSDYRARRRIAATCG